MAAWFRSEKMDSIVPVPQVDRTLENNVRVSPEAEKELLALPAFREMTDGALIKAAERLSLSGVRVTGRAMAIALLMGARTLNDVELQTPLSQI
jgi:hypothetical protein